MKKRALESVIQKRRASLSAVSGQIENLKAMAFSHAEISDAQKNYSTALFNNLKHGGDGTSKSVTDAHAAYVAALNAYGFNEDMFEYTAKCGLCGDTGIHGGNLCACAKKEYITALKQECSSEKTALFKLKDCNYDLIENLKQRDELKLVYETLLRYIKQFPKINRNAILISGGTGTGKSCLVSVLANAALDSGKSALLFSAYEFNSKMLACHIAPIIERDGLMHDILTTDILIIDDLGTEPMLRNVTLEYLLLVLEERLRTGKATIIATNLSPARILNIYGERIYSRLSDKRHALCIELHGNDIRR